MQQLTEIEILEGNKLIADSPFSNCTKSFETYFNSKEKFHFELHEAEYHSNWNELMPVVEKIEDELKENTESEFKIDWLSGASIYIPKKLNIRFLYDSKQRKKVEAVWQAVVGFIKWYNNQNK